MQRKVFLRCHHIVKKETSFLINNFFTFGKYPYFYNSLNLN
jgi:hypothetical protein